MELYYKDLISEEATVEELVEDLMLVVQGAGALAEAAGVSLSLEQHRELATRLERLKATCRQLQERVAARGRAADRVVHRYPYSCAGLAFGLGLAAGYLWLKRRRD